MSKKFLLILGIVIIIAVAAFLVLSSNESGGEGDNRVGFSIMDYFPFGNNEETYTPDTNTNTEQGISTSTSSNINSPVPRLRKISNEPVAGSVVFNIGTTTFVRFVEKGTGNVYEARSDSNKIERLSNTTIPKIVRAKWLPNATGFLAQTLDIANNLVETSFVKLSKNSSLDEGTSLYNTTISKLPTGIEEVAISPDSSKIFYYLKGVSSFWFIAKPDGTSRSHIYTSPVLEWIPKWIDNKNIFIYTKPSIGAKTFAYNFDTSTKSLTKTSVDGFGISFNPNSPLSLVSTGGDANISLINNTTLEKIDLNTNTPPEKCDVTKNYVYCAVPQNSISGFPDVWYKSTVSTNDYISRIDYHNLFYSNIINLSEEIESGVDVDEISVSSDESYIIFRNKKDEFLWILRIEK